MKIQDALNKITKRSRHKDGFLVTFERIEGCILVSDHFPDVHSFELPIQTESEAWALAEKFAGKTRGEMVNIYVIKASDFTPVDGYSERLIKNR